MAFRSEPLYLGRDPVDLYVGEQTRQSIGCGHFAEGLGVLVHAGLKLYEKLACLFEDEGVELFELGILRLSYSVVCHHHYKRGSLR